MFARKHISLSRRIAGRVLPFGVGVFIALQSTTSFATGTTPDRRSALAPAANPARSGLVRPSIVVPGAQKLTQRDSCIPYLIAGADDSGGTVSGARDPNQRKRRCRVYLIVDRPETRTPIGGKLS